MAGHGGGGTGPLASKTRAMILKSLVPLVQVRNLRRSVDFYRTLGFAEENTHTPEGGSEFYLYSPDVPGFRNMLIEAGVDAGPIQHPFYAPRGEFRVTDPDGYVLMVTHT
jgi:catechol 2,3-dioxygenase-like lactoylglutathione lyase family enzyme